MKSLKCRKSYKSRKSVISVYKKVWYNWIELTHCVGWRAGHWCRGRWPSRCWRAAHTHALGGPHRYPQYYPRPPCSVGYSAPIVERHQSKLSHNKEQYLEGHFPCPRGKKGNITRKMTYIIKLVLYVRNDGFSREEIFWDQRSKHVREGPLGTKARRFRIF